MCAIMSCVQCAVLNMLCTILSRVQCAVCNIVVCAIRYIQYDCVCNMLCANEVVGNRFVETESSRTYSA